MRMRRNRVAATATLMTLVLAFSPVSTVAATPIRHPSGNGQEPNVTNWNLLGPTSLISFSGVNMRLQVRCSNQDVADSSTVLTGATTPDPVNAGGCSSGTYLFEVQIPSQPKKLAVTFSNLINFTFSVDPVGGTVGVMRCDQPGVDDINTAALCTNDATVSIPDITITHNGNTEVTFSIPEIPNFPPVACTPDPVTPVLCRQGQGLTLFLEIGSSQTTPPMPVGFPTITTKRW
jgi:hypothetical protein